MPPLDVTRYQLAAPGPDKAHDPAAWRAAVDNAQAQLEHQHNRVQNLELMLKYGPNTWRAQVRLRAARFLPGSGAARSAAPGQAGCLPHRPPLPPWDAAPLQNQLSEALLSQQEAEAAVVKRSTDALNRERKLQQTSTGLELRRLEDEWAGGWRLSWGEREGGAARGCRMWHSSRP
jgi:pre-mRNA-splicing factor SPF27